MKKMNTALASERNAFAKAGVDRRLEAQREADEIASVIAHAEGCGFSSDESIANLRSLREEWLADVAALDELRMRVAATVAETCLPPACSDCGESRGASDAARIASAVEVFRSEWTEGCERVVRELASQCARCLARMHSALPARRDDHLEAMSSLTEHGATRDEAAAILRARRSGTGPQS